MPHIALKMLEGRTEEQKQRAAEKLTAALSEVLGCSTSHITLSIQEYSALEWQGIFRSDIKENPGLVIEPKYDPKDLL